MYVRQAIELCVLLLLLLLYRDCIPCSAVIIINVLQTSQTEQIIWYNEHQNMLKIVRLGLARQLLHIRVNKHNVIMLIQCEQNNRPVFK